MFGTFRMHLSKLYKAIMASFKSIDYISICIAFIIDLLKESSSRVDTLYILTSKYMSTLTQNVMNVLMHSCTYYIFLIISIVLQVHHLTMKAVHTCVYICTKKCYNNHMRKVSHNYPHQSLSIQCFSLKIHLFTIVCTYIPLAFV